MAEFSNIIDIVIPPIDYTGKTSITLDNNCSPGATVYNNIILENIDTYIYGLISNHSGTAWKFLNLTNISISKAGIPISLEYNSTKLIIEDLPIQIDIQALSAGDTIPDFKVKTVTNDTITVSNYSILLTFNIEDINGDTGPSINSSFQFQISQCNIPVYYPPNITSTLEITFEAIDGDALAFFNYQITADNPVTSYEASNYPSQLIFNPVTGYLTGNIYSLQHKYDTIEVYINIAAVQSNAVPDRDDQILHLIIKPKVDIPW